MSSSVKPVGMPRLHAVAVVHRCVYRCVCSSAGHWDSMEEYTCMIPRDTHDGAFYRAVLALHQDLFSLAQQVSCGAAENSQRWFLHPSPLHSCSLYINQCVFLETEPPRARFALQSLEFSSVSLKEIQKHWNPCTHRNV